MEGFLKEKGGLQLPKIDASSQDTIFEYVVNSAGNWEHWSDRVSHLAPFRACNYVEAMASFAP